MKLIVGLGNPGKQYERTRHNVGFVVLDALREKQIQADDWKMNKKFHGEIAEIFVNGTKHLLLKPMTYMNESGQAIRAVCDFYKLDPDDVIVVHDEKDIALGDVRVQFDRGAAGNNGIKSTIAHLGTKAFHRVRVGIASKNKRKMDDTSKFVLGKFGLFEKGEMREAVDAAVNEIEKML